MKRFKIYLFLIFVGSSFIANTAPQLELISGDTFDWGEVTQFDSPLYDTLVMRNNSPNDTLIIYAFEPGCGCTFAPFTKNFIEPGETMVIPIKQEVENFLGHVHKKIKVTTNDPIYKYFEIHLKALVIPSTKLKGKVLDFGKVKIGTEVKSTVKLDNKSSMPVKILKINNNCPDLSINVKIGDIITPNGELTLEASYKPSVQGKLSDKIIIFTNNPQTGKIEISLIGEAIN